MFFFLNLALSLLPPTATPSPTRAQSILAAVPDEASALAYCGDFAGLRARALRNDWFKLVFSDRGEPLLAGLEQEFRMQTQTQMSELYSMTNLLRGESLFFVAGETAGFLTTPPAQRAELSAAMRAWLPASGTEGIRAQVQVGVAQVEFAAWPTEGQDSWQRRVGHFAAFVDHPRALGLFSADSKQALQAEIQAVLEGLDSLHRSPLVTGLNAARGTATPSAGIEFYVDFTSKAAEAETLLAQAGTGVLPDPSGMLGLEQGTWLHVNADLQAGRRVDCDAFLNIPRDTLAAALADTFSPLPADLPGRLPKNLWGLYSLQWDIGEFYETARAAFVKKQGAESLQAVDAGLMAAKSMTGVAPIQDVLGLLDGSFALYFVEQSGVARAAEPEFDDSRDFGALFGLKNGDLFLDAFEKLIDVGDLASQLDLIDMEGVDVYTYSKHLPESNLPEERFDGGLAFLPSALILTMKREVMTRSLHAMQGIAGTSALDDETILGAFNDNSGVCFLSCVKLRAVQQQHLAEIEELKGSSADSPVADPFDSLLTSSVRRTPDGFRFRLTNL